MDENNLENSNVNDVSEQQPEPAKKRGFKAPSLRNRKAAITGFFVAVLAIGGAVFFLQGNTTEEGSTPDVVQNSEQAPQVFVQGAVITDLNGTVEYNVGEGWNEVEPGQDLQEGHQLRTLDDSRAVVSLDDGSAIRLDSDTVITVVSLTTADVTIQNETGQVYSRVTESDTRVYTVNVGEDEYQALGTAYKTVNDTEEKGVEVYHSKVKATDSEKEEKEVGEGEAFFSKSSDPELVDKVSKLDLEKLKDDEFLKWNQEKDKSEKEFSDKLGFIKDIDQPKDGDSEPAATSSDGISAWGSTYDDGVKISWSVKGVNTSNGFKVVYSTKDSTPSYGEDAAQYAGAGDSSKKLNLTDGNKYYFRVCAWNGGSGCSSYSNTVTVTAPKKEKEKVTEGTMSAELDGNTLAWSFSGNAPHGYKVVVNQEGEPEYPSDSKFYSGSTSVDMTKVLKNDEAGTYKVRVCAYTAGTQDAGCVYYSNQVEYVKE